MKEEYNEKDNMSDSEDGFTFGDLISSIYYEVMLERYFGQFLNKELPQLEVIKNTSGVNNLINETLKNRPGFTYIDGAFTDGIIKPFKNDMSSIHPKAQVRNKPKFLTIDKENK